MCVHVAVERNDEGEDEEGRYFSMIPYDIFLTCGVLLM